MMNRYKLNELDKDGVLRSNIVLTESLAYDIAYPTFGFVMIRHVNSKQTDYFWKECYTCIRKWYTEPILIVDDSSDPSFLNDNMNLVNCQIVYDTKHKGCAELLGYYYFELMRPFETAVIIHDSVFIQKRVDFSVKGMKPLWTFPRHWDHELNDYYYDLCKDMPMYGDIIRFYHGGKWEGFFGLMSVIRWDFVKRLKEYGLFTVMDKIRGRDARSAMERVLGFLAYYVGADSVNPSMYGEIHSYLPWGGTFLDYLRDNGFNTKEIIKVWTGR
jgi:hypothetical protein